MIITEVRALVPPEAQLPRDWRGWFAQILVEVKTDEGLRRYGIGGGGEAGVHVVETVLRANLVGGSPAEVEALWDEMYRKTLPIGRKGSPSWPSVVSTWRSGI